MKLSRRSLLAGATALTVMAPGVKAAFGAADPNADVVIVLFQRGACDWLQMLAPSGDANYIAARPTIRVPATGNNAGIGLATLNGTDLYLSNSAPELKTLYDAGSLAFVHATGLYTADRSHFLCQANMEKGQADADPKQNTGWLARHLTSIGPGSALSTISSGSTNPVSLLGAAHPLAVSSASSFNISGGTVNLNTIRAINSGGGAFIFTSPFTTAEVPSSPYKAVAQETVNTVSTIQSNLANLDNTTANAAGYTGGALSQSLRSVAQLIRMNVGLNLVTVDYGGWDMHNSLVGEFRTRTTEFSRAISAFWTDMADYRSRITLVTMTEFGRRLQENSSQGTDHGSASGMLVLGGNVNGGKVYGSWPGLASSQLTTGDLKVTTDYRQVLAEILVARHSEKNIASVFPTVTYNPLGIMRANAA
jgi:uncharacterized protein (DUF1501 family)